MKYKLFMSDFDGTLKCPTADAVSEKNLQAIARYRAAGGTFVVCTGRMLSSILPVLRGLGVSEGLVSAYQGATIADIATGKLLKDGAFEFDDALKTVRLLESLNQHVHVYTVDALYCNRDDEWLKGYEKVCGVKGTIRENLTCFIEETKLRVVKVLAIIDPADGETLRQKLTGLLGEKHYVTFSSPFMLEVTPACNTKGTAVKFLSDYYGVDLSEIAAIGDQLNDLPMLEVAGGKYTVADGDDRLKGFARVMPRCDEDAVAAAIEEILADK